MQFNIFNFVITKSWTISFTALNLQTLDVGYQNNLHLTTTLSGLPTFLGKPIFNILNFN
jgi:hypothetical protein